MYVQQNILSRHDTITHCRYYNAMSNFNRLLLLLSNEVMIKSRDVVGPKVLSDPELVYVYVCM